MFVRTALVCGNYTLFRPDASLGRDGFKHPIVSWGNGISTTPDHYKSTLTLLATHGFVVIACNDAGAKSYFYGDDCALCKAPWAAAQRKNWP